MARQSSHEHTIDASIHRDHAVSPDLQRRGVGSMIVRFACATLQRRGHHVVSLLTSDKIDRDVSRRDFSCPSGETPPRISISIR